MVDHFTDQFIIQSPVFIPRGDTKENGGLPPHVIADMSFILCWIFLIFSPVEKIKKKHKDTDISEHGFTSAAVCISLELLNVK